MEDIGRKENRALERARTLAKKHVEYERRSAEPSQLHWQTVARKHRTSSRSQRSARASKKCKRTYHPLVEQEQKIPTTDDSKEAPLVDDAAADSADGEVAGPEQQVPSDDLASLLRKAEEAPERAPEIVQAIVQAMAVNVEDLVLQTASVQALDQLASGGACNAAAVAQAGGIEILVRIAGIHKAEILQEVICKVLRSIIVVGLDFRAAVASSDGVRVVVGAMTMHRTSVAVQLAACRALKELAAHSAQIQEEICLQGGIEAVLGAMELHSSDAGMQEAACGVLRNLSAGNAKRQNQIAGLGGLRLVLVAMSVHIQDALVQWAGCWALFCLTLQNTELQGKVVAGSGMQHVLQAMDGHRSVARVQEAGCWAIKVLSTAGEPILALSARGAVFLAMRTHPLDEQVQHAGRAALQSAGAFIAPKTATRIHTDAAAHAKSTFTRAKSTKNSPIFVLPTIPE